ncbi:DedA family protein [Cryobacterium tagatosivorans]|uniref:DedA family protein n=1 Tax=Cryobacterium tagatosivorans TaxID=1259199 RepID=A0A4R8UHE6_9MICO|nr:DedA family protein [Cryobacterium tagatosivorans]
MCPRAAGTARGFPPRTSRPQRDEVSPWADVFARVDGAIAPVGDLPGLVGVAVRLVERLGEWGVGLFTLAETVFPPLPSEVILPLAGFLGQQGELNGALLVVTSTLGAYLGALLLYGLGARLGLERSIRWLAKLPLVDRDDWDRAARWFGRHGRSAVFFGRLVPGIRSLVSLPAGAARMNLASFSIFTIAGSAIWNTFLILLGAALGTQYELVARYALYLNYVLYAAIIGVVVWLVLRRMRGRRAAGARADDSANDPD